MPSKLDCEYYIFSEQQTVRLLLFIFGADVNSAIDQPIDDRWSRLFAGKLEFETVAAFQFFRDHGIEPLLIKGWASARNYPVESPRFYTDVDISVSSADFDRAKDLLSLPAASKIAVDLHRELKRLDQRPWLDVFADSIEVELSGYPVRIPAAEDHLRILAVHWLNDGGERKERLLDIYYAVQNRPSDFDWDRCLNPISKVRRGWVLAAIGLTHRYFGLDISDLPAAKEAADLPEWLCKTVEKEWSLGIPSRSLHTCLNNPKEFFRQLRKRIPPNPLQATIEQEGDIRARSRLPYQLGSMRDRMLPSLKGIRDMIRSRSK